MWVYALVLLLIHNIKADEFLCREDKSCEVTLYRNAECTEEDEGSLGYSLEACNRWVDTGSDKFTCNGNDWKLEEFDLSLIHI